jgi:hypothetical protein
MKRSVAILLLLIALAVAGLAWNLSQQQLSELTFAQRRIGILESENRRLATLLAKQQESTAESSALAIRAELEREVTKIRGLTFLRPVDYEIVTRDEIRQIVEEKIAQQYSEAELENMSIGLAAMGVLDPNYPLRTKLIDLLSEQVAAFYDQHRHKLFMFREANLSKMENRIVLVHELVHALQDQHFDLKGLPLEVKDNDDKALAASALVEGDATLVMTEYMLRHSSIGNWRDQVLAAISQDMGELQKAPLYLREMLIFPYIQGQQFCTTLHTQGGYARVSAAFKHPPSSTSLILHPEKYIEESREEPVSVTFESTKLDGSEAILNNVLGEFGVRVLFTKWLDAGLAETAALGWRGDRYLVFEGGNALIWKSVWANEDDAREFAKAAAEYLRKRYAFQHELASPSAFSIDTPRALRIKRSGTTVVLIDAKDTKSAEALDEKISES